MTVTVKVLVPAKTVENTQTTQYTSLGVTTLIDKLTATNYSALPANIVVNLVTSGSGAGLQNIIVKSKVLQASETYTFPEIVGYALGPGDFISTIVSAADSINMRSSGRVIS